MYEETVSTDGLVGTIRTLVVDDEPGLADVVATHLERADERIEAKTATSVDEALATIADTELDCIVSDYEMPGRDGLELLDAVRTDHPDIPFILFTGKGSESVASRAFSASATDYLQKGGTSDQYVMLADRVRQYAERAWADRQRRRHLAAIESAHEGIAILDSHERFRYVNDAYADLYGYTPAEMVGEKCDLTYPDEEEAFVREEILPTVEETGDWSGETTGRRADGSTFIAEQTVSRTAGGDFVCTVVDITDWKQRTEERDRYRALVESLDDAVYVLGPAGRFLYVNDAFVDLVDYDYETILGSTPDLIKDEATVERTERHLGRLLADDGPDSVTFEMEIEPKEGEPIPCEDHMGVLPYEGDQFRGSVGVLRDVSAREERDRELREHRALLEQSLDALDDVFFVFGRDGELARWNDRLPEVTGYTDVELDGMSPAEFFPDDHRERIERAVETVFETGHTEVRADYLLKDGTRVPYEFKATRLDGPAGDVLGFAGIGRDITETLEYERRLERQNERLEEFASVLSHDLRNPLNVAEGRLEIAREERGSVHLDAVSEAHDRMETLIGELLTLAREGDEATDLQAVSVGEQATRSWETMTTDEASLVVEDEHTVEADESRLQQLFENLFRNSVEHGSTDSEGHGPSGSRPPADDSRAQSGDSIEHGSEGVQVRVGTLPAERGFYVADDGPGIPESERDRVFESGYSTGGDGIGAGLSIVKQVVDAHGWTVRVTESRDGGARIEIVVDGT
ncbi:PAS domain S-box protein [Haloplanus aerogenes]|uniref:histidine kinase n=1 Tax=Haloplanus aerogenes TaxID=660522 RepID=A0A3M0DB35_9EURY|nr:PAS domain S-box protein [Haloplanus aerogenes]AZH26106.1 PAS domain S-box protein [Haloplanus aerogenes]RMB18445.1 PAS domain S-box-containing protein [Haloplanus aerogenes]